jgi:hypothetical protein
MELCSSHSDMKSRLAAEARQSLNEDLRRLTPEERLAGQDSIRATLKRPVSDAH